MRVLVTLAALFCSGAACAAACQKIDYAEVKDWPVESVEAAYCADRASMHEAISLAAQAGKPYLLTYGEECAHQVALYERVLKNLHRRPVPKCR